MQTWGHSVCKHMHHFLGVPWLSTSTRIFTWIYWEGGFQSAVLSYIVNKFTRFSSFFRHWFAHSILLYRFREYLVVGLVFFIIIDDMFIYSYMFYNMNQSYIFRKLVFFLICKKITKLKALHKLKEKKCFFSVKTFTTSTSMYHISTFTCFK